MVAVVSLATASFAAASVEEELARPLKPVADALLVGPHAVHQIQLAIADAVLVNAEQPAFADLIQ